VPDVWSPSSVDLVVSEPIANRLSEIPGVRFQDVCFLKVVDLPMPALGDSISWDRPGPIDPDRNFEDLADNAELRMQMGIFKAIACPVVYLIRKQLADKQRIKPNFGTYAGAQFVSARFSRTIIFSRALLGRFPIVWDSVFIIREDAFSIIAPHLNLDYFHLAWKEFED